MPDRPTDTTSTPSGLFGAGILMSQVYLIAVGLSVHATQWLLVGHSDLVSTLLYTFIAGNAVSLLLGYASPLFDQPFPRNWIVYIALLMPVSVVASALGGVLDHLILRRPLSTLAEWRGDIAFGSLIVFVLGFSDYLFITTRRRMQEANAVLAQQVQLGRSELASHASELQAAFDIQSSLLPRTVPQIAGVQISCAWQPARTVSGDFFDVLVLDENRIAFCLADVSGKGMSAALITANLQATFRAFAPNESSPARLCQRLNDALCTNLPASRFVTLAYGIVNRADMSLVYELAGHNSPLLLRGTETVVLNGTGPVLGLLPGAVFTDQRLTLKAGDRLLLFTDGVTEAFNTNEEEFGEDRLVDAARGASSSAHAVRTAIMDGVSAFAQGSFHDDASVMVVAIQS